MTKHNGMQKQWDRLRIRSGAEAAAAALFSVSAACLTGFFVSRAYYKRLPVYSEFTAGGTVYSGYNKQGDMCLFYLLIVLFPVLFAGFLFLKHYLQDTVQPAFLNSAQTYRKDERKQQGGIRLKKAENIAVPMIMGCSAVRAAETVLTAGNRTFSGFLAKLSICCMILWCVFVLIYAVSAEKRKQDMTGFRERTSACFQLVLPVVFLGYSRFYYDYERENTLIELYHSAKWKGFCLLLTAALFLWQCCRIYRRKTGISVCSYAVLSVMITTVQPEGSLSVDFFHNGEMALPMQQLLSYGKIPYFDLDPIHGFCDFLYSFFNYLFFDGSYFSQNAGIMAAGMLMAAVLAVLIGLSARNDGLKLVLILIFMPYFVEKAGIRYFILFAAFMILLSDRVRKNSHHFIWWWTVLSMAAVAYHVSIGASMAAAFFPEAVYRFVKDVIPELKGLRCTDNVKKKRGLLLGYGGVFILGLFYIPWFIRILRYLRENAGTTLWVNGTEIFGTDFHPVRTFAFLAVYLAFLVSAFYNNPKGRSAFVSMACCLAVILNYSGVRYDEGQRFAVLAVFFGFLYFLYLYENGVSGRILKIYHCLLLLLCLYLCYGSQSYGSFGTEFIEAEKEVNILGEAVEDPVVYVSGESVDMPNLGTGFIQGLTLNSLKNIQLVLEQEYAKDSWLDLTNKISHAVIFDSEVNYPVTSAYNAGNILLQEKMIERIQTEKPHLILLSPYIRFDRAPLCIRSFRLYQALFDMGYKPYAYEDVVYLLNGESCFADAVPGERKLGELNHVRDLGMLPYLWGTASEEKRTLVEVPADIHCLSGAETAFMEIIADADTISSHDFVLTFQSDVDGEFYDFTIDTGLEKIKKSDQKICYLIPLRSSPFFMYSEDVDLQIKGIIAEEIHFYKVK